MGARASLTVCPLRARTCSSSVITPNAKIANGDLEARSKVIQKPKNQTPKSAAAAVGEPPFKLLWFGPFLAISIAVPVVDSYLHASTVRLDGQFLIL